MWRIEFFVCLFVFFSKKRAFRHLERDVVGADEAAEPRKDAVEEGDEGQEGDQVGDDVHHQEDGVAGALRRGVQRVRLRPVADRASKGNIGFNSILERQRTS